MNDETALLRAICEHPDEDTPRLVFADWLQEQGGAVDAAWALGIRAEIAVGHGATDEPTLQRARMFAQPFARQRVCARLGVPPDWAGVEWDRGFPCVVRGEFDAVSAAWPRMTFRAPIRTLRFFELSTDQAAEFVTWPGLECLRGLSFLLTEAGEHDDLIVLLTDCPGLNRLEALSVGSSLLGEMAALALLNSPYLSGLKTLAVSYGWLRGSLPPELEARLTARFGPDVVYDDVIPF